MAAVTLAMVQCPAWGVEDPPLGLGQMAGCVTHCGQEAKVFDLNVALWREGLPHLKDAWSWDALHLWNDPSWVADAIPAAWLDRKVSEILSTEPDAVAFSIAMGSQFASLETARRIKRLSPGTTVIFGGPYAQAVGRAEELARDADIVVVGVGEDLFPKMIGLYKSSRRWVPLPGMLVKDRDGVVRGGRPIPYTFDLDISPFPDFSSFSWSDYARPDQLPVSASRGCPWTCAFCASREYWAKWSFKSGDRIAGDVDRLCRENPAGRRVRFYDIMANGNASSLTHFAELMARHGFTARGISWTMNAAPTEATDSKALGSWRAGGCDEIVFGVESGSETVLGAMGRAARPETAERVLRSSHDAGIRTVASFITGFPGETEDDFERTRTFLKRARASLDGVCIAPASPEEPSLWSRRPERFGAPAPGAARARVLMDDALGLGLAMERARFAIGDAPAVAV